MKRLQTKGIVLTRTDYGEADRIITVLTPDQGKLRLMARGVRKPKSKLAGGIELFSTSDLMYMPGKGEIGTLISARLIKYYSDIVKDINRVQLGYELIKTLNRSTEDHPEEDYYQTLEEAFKSLNDHSIPNDLIKLWFQAMLLKLGGHQPNLSSTAEGDKLQADQKYNFDFENMAFFANPNGQFKADHIKFLRLVFTQTPQTLSKVEGNDKLVAASETLMFTAVNTYLRA